MRDVTTTQGKQRIPVTVFSQVAGGTDIRCNVKIDANCAPFWEGVDSNGYRIYFGDGGGNLLTWSRTTWDYANKDAELRVDYTTPSDSGTSDNVLIWMYVKDSTGGATDLAGAPSFTTAKDAKAQSSSSFPVVAEAKPLVVTDESTPTIEVGGPPLALAKDSAVIVAVPLRDRLQRWTNGVTINDSAEQETPRFITAGVVDSSAEALSNWLDIDSVRFAFSAPLGSYAVYLTLTPDTADDAVLTVTVGTSLGQKIPLHVRLASAVPSL